jgi:hypothetical protein
MIYKFFEMTNKMVAEGMVTIRERKFYYEFWSDTSDVMVKIFHRGKKGDFTEFLRNDKLGLKQEMETALSKAKFL